jgi:hypothetical protein
MNYNLLKSYNTISLDSCVNAVVKSDTEEFIWDTLLEFVIFVGF